MHCSVVILVATATLAGQPSQAASAGQRPPLHTKCIISAIREVEVPAQRIGMLMLLAKREGDAVDQGSVVARIDDRDSQARAKAATFRQEQAELQATNRYRVEAAEKAAEAAWVEHEQAEQINKRSPGAVSDIEVRRLKVQADRLDLTVKSESQAVEEAKALNSERQEEVKVAQNDLTDRTVTSPFSGVVAELFREQGEWLRQGDPIMRIVQMDRLSAEAYVRMSDVLPFQVEGLTVTVEVQFGNGISHTFRDCPITNISPEVEPGGRYRLRAEVPNRRWDGSNQWILRPGIVAEMIIRLQ